MTKIEEVLKEWEFLAKQQGIVASDFFNILTSIRISIKGCSVLRWHPGDEIPPETGTYLCELAAQNAGTERLPQRFEEARCSQGWWWNGVKILRWTELPERSA